MGKIHLVTTEQTNLEENYSNVKRWTQNYTPLLQTLSNFE